MELNKKQEVHTHKIGIYLWIWGLLFVFSFFSYMVDYLNFQGLLRWTLIVFFMLAKAGFIMAIFMHLYWERWAIVNVLLWPMTLIGVFIAIMTFVLITSSGTMAIAVKYGYEKNRKLCGWFLMATAIGGLTFVGMQAFEWSKLIFHDGVRPWYNPFGAEQFGAFFFMVTGFHGTHVSIGVIFLFIFARKVFRGDFDTGRKGYFTSMKSDYEAIEILGLYWHFVDLVWVFIFAFFYLW